MSPKLSIDSDSDQIPDSPATSSKPPGLAHEVADEARDVMEPLMPWVASLLLHAGVALLAVFAAYTAGVDSPVDHTEVIVPTSVWGTTPTIPIHLSNLSRSVTDTRLQSGPTSVTTSARAGAGTSSNSPDGLHVIGLDGSFGDHPGNGLETQTALAAGPGNIPGNHSPAFTGTRAQSPFPSTFGGLPCGNARKIVYLVDASGNLIDTFPFIIADLKRALFQLVDQQSFTVIFFQNGTAIELSSPSTGFKKADSAHKTAAIEWLTRSPIVPIGSGSPIPALKLAMSYRPDLIYILSGNITGSGVHQVDQRQLLAEIHSTDRHTVKINTIQFIHADPLESIGTTGTLRRISKETAGVHRFLSARDLGIE